MMERGTGEKESAPGLASGELEPESVPLEVRPGVPGLKFSGNHRNGNGRRGMTLRRRGLLILFLVTACVGADQAAKAWARAHLSGGSSLSLAGGTLKLDYHENQDGVFSFE